MAATVTDVRTATSISTPAARLAFAAGAGFLLLLAVVLVAKPDLDPSWQPISAYALGDHGWLMTLGFLLWGVSAIGTVVALSSHVLTLGGRIGLGFLLIGASGPILAAIFPMDSITTGVEEMTMSGNLHSLGAVLGDGIPIGAALITWSLVRWNPAWLPARRPLIWAAVIVWVSVVVVTAMMAVLLPQHGGQLGPDVPIGWPSRFMAAAYVVWLMIAARFTLRLARTSHVST